MMSTPWFGRVSHRKGRFGVAAVASRAELSEVRALFGQALLSDDLLSCLVLIEPDSHDLTQQPIADLVRYLEEKYLSGTCTRRNIE